MSAQRKTVIALLSICFAVSCREAGTDRSALQAESLQILVNQVGYERDGVKRAVIRTARATRLEACEVLAWPSGEVVHRGTPVEEGPVARWRDWHFWSFDFSDLRQSGTFYLRAGGGGLERESLPFTIDDQLLLKATLSDLLYFFKSQRCSGRYDQTDRSVPFFGSRKGTVDVHGGWYDASGDTSKYLSHLSYANYMNPQQTPAVVWALLDSHALLRNSAWPLAGDMGHRFLDEALHGADFLVRMQDPEGYFYATVFDRWSKDVEQRMICSYSTQDGIRSEDYQAGYREGGGMAVAALARASTADYRGDFTSQQYLAAAERGFRHLEQNNLRYLDDGKENIIDDYCALMAASELFAATAKDPYLQAAERRAAGLAARISEGDRYSGWWRADDAGRMPYFHAAEAGLPVIALLRFLEVAGDRTDRAKYAAAVERSLRFELQITGEVVNPFGYARQYVKATDSEPRTSFFFPHKNPSGYWWQGENARIASLAAAAFRSARLFGDAEFVRSLKRYAVDQLNWILGLNPFDICMLDGHGRNNPEYEPGYLNAPGGIVNGITAGFEDEEDIDFLPPSVAGKGEHRWRWSEQWLPHAAWYLSAISSGAPPKQP